MLTPLLLAVSVAASPASVVTDTALEVAAPTDPDTIPHFKPRLFEKRVLFNPEYLGRLLYTVGRASAPPDPEIAIISPAESAEALAYADRYGIEVSLAGKIIENAIAEGIDPELAFRLVRVESVFVTNARGPQGALGLTQLMPATARSVDRSLRTDAAILDPDANLRTGFRYLRSLIERYDGNLGLGLLAYNRGTGTVDRALRAGRSPDNGYSRRVLEVAGTPYTGTGLLPTIR